MFVFLATAETKIKQDQLAGEYLPIPDNIPTEFTLLNFGLSYSVDVDSNLIVILPEYFKQSFKKRLEEYQKNRYIYLLNSLHKNKLSADSSRNFEFLISLSFYQMLNINIKENIRFIKNDIEVIKSKTIQIYNSIKTTTPDFSTNIDDYFEEMGINSINVPEDQSYGADCWIKLQILNALKYIMIGLQMKCYFTKKTNLTSRISMKK